MLTLKLIKTKQKFNRNYTITIKNKKYKKQLDKIGTIVFQNNKKYILLDYKKLLFWLNKGLVLNTNFLYYLEILYFIKHDKFI